MKLKYHRLITVLTELALVCLLFVTIVGCIPRTVKQSQTSTIEQSQNNGGLSLSVDKVTTSDQGISFGNGTVQDGYVISGSFATNDSSGTANRVELQTGESGNIQYFVSGSQIEAVTDENGNIYYQINTNADTILNQKEPTIHETVVSIHPVAVAVYVCDLLACVLLLLYVMKFFNHGKANVIMMLVFAASFLASALGIVYYILFIPADTVAVLIYCIRYLVECILFALLAVQALKNTLTTKVALIAMIGICGCRFIPYMTGLSFVGFDVLDTIATLLGIVGFLTFTVAWFLCSFKEQDAPAVEAAEPVAPAAE